MKQSDSVLMKLFIALILMFSMAWVSFQAWSSSNNHQDPKTLLFQEAEQARKQAQAVQAKIFSPSQFATAMKNYQQADENYKKGKNLEDIQKKLKTAAVYFLKSVETAKLVQANLSDCVSARNDALSAEAILYRKEEWEEAESSFRQAAKTLEDGNLNGAKSRAQKAEQLYRAVELESIKAAYLDETRSLLEDAKKKDVKRRAPITLAKAQELAQRAETLLAENRYDTDEARQIAQEARYEAKHANFLAQSIQRLENKNKTIEEIFLDSEKPIQRISEHFDLNPMFDKGYEEPTSAIVQEIQKLQKEASSLRQDLNDKSEQLTALSKQVSEMESQLGDLKSKEATLTKVMEQQKQAREKFARIEKSFSPEEAQILRVGDQVIIRLYGLTFPVGKATIEPQYFGLLSKVLKATEEYPDSKITIEGHTDSWGGDAANQKLSTERANAVREYFLATAGIDSSRVIAVGYGESKPIASNETKEGRRKNRRIDTLIHPKK